MKQSFERGLQQIQQLSKPQRYAILGALWLFTVAVVTILEGFLPAVIASTVAVSFVYLLKPYRERYPNKGIIALLKSLIDVRRPTLHELSLAVIGVGAIILTELCFALVLGLLETKDPTGHGVARAAASSPDLFTLAMIFLGATIIAPPMEELVFRNGLQKLLALRVGDIAAIVATSTIFATLHIPAYGGFSVGISSLALPLSVVFTGSVVFGVLYWRTRNVVVPMLSHGLFNAVVLLYTVFRPPLLG